MRAVEIIKKLYAVISDGPGLGTIELADTVSGGHIAKALTESDELFGAAVDLDTREAALAAFDLARLNNSRFLSVLEVLKELFEREDGLEKAWQDKDNPPEFRDLVAGAALVSTFHQQQQSRGRRQLIIDALAGSFCPEPYIWGFQDTLLRSMMEAHLTPADIDLLLGIKKQNMIKLDIGNLHISSDIDGFERLATARFVQLTAVGGGMNIVLNRYEIPAGRGELQVQMTHTGEKFLTMLSAGRSLQLS